MNFEEALPLYREGRKIKRAGWDSWWNDASFTITSMLADDWIVESQKWEPKGGKWYISPAGTVTHAPSHACRKPFGTERKTKELAEKASEEMRVFNRLLAYRDEFAPDYAPKWNTSKRNYYIYYDHVDDMWACSSNDQFEVTGVVYFPHSVAIELVKKLNSGEVEL